ncbi:MAG TPA: hypothetical protein VGD24_09625 [Gallionella sp.]
MILAGFIAQPAFASDDFETYRLKQHQAAQAASAEFQEYKEKEDRDFASFLKARWQEFETHQGRVRIKEPKPRQVPAIMPSARPVSPPLPAPEAAKPVRPSSPRPLAAPAAPPAKPVGQRFEVMFYGNRVGFDFDEKWTTYRLSKGARAETMSTFWTMMSGSKYEPTIRTIGEVRRELKLDDWGHVALWREVVRALQPDRLSEQNLLLWYFLVKSGYDVRLGYHGSDVHLFVAVKQQVYSTKFTTVGGQTYYAVMATDHGDSIGSFYTYEANYPNKLSPLDIGSASTGFTKAASMQRNLSFEYQNKSIRLDVPYDRDLVQYMGTYPQSEFELYFDTGGSSLLAHGLLTELEKHTSKMNEEEAVNFLLAFVQQSFPYKTDDEQFGREKYFFVEESLHYPYNDCEDRSVLFSWLVSRLLGIKVVGLVYPGHMTTAVALKTVKPGYATADYQGNHLVIADPTYIGATVGMAMPSYEKLKPKRVIDTRF